MSTPAKESLDTSPAFFLLYDSKKLKNTEDENGDSRFEDSIADPTSSGRTASREHNSEATIMAALTRIENTQSKINERLARLEHKLEGYLENNLKHNPASTLAAETSITPSGQPYARQTFRVEVPCRRIPKQATNSDSIKKAKEDRPGVPEHTSFSSAQNSSPSDSHQEREDDEAGWRRIQLGESTGKEGAGGSEDRSQDESGSIKIETCSLPRGAQPSSNEGEEYMTAEQGSDIVDDDDISSEEADGDIESQPLNLDGSRRKMTLAPRTRKPRPQLCNCSGGKFAESCYTLQCGCTANGIECSLSCKCKAICVNSTVDRLQAVIADNTATGLQKRLARESLGSQAAYSQRYPRYSRRSKVSLV